MQLDTSLVRRLGIRWPIFQAPMAGAAATDLAVAVGEAGGLGALSVALEPAARISEQAQFVRARTKAPFNLNLFAYEPSSASADQLRRMHERLAPIRAELGIPSPKIEPVARELDAQYEAAIRVAPPVFSFTFGIPRREYLDAFRKSGTFLIGTATHPDEARALADAGVDAICAQGSEAGGHRGTFLGDARDALIGTSTLVPLCRAAVKLPIIAAGGIMDGRGVAAMLALGAEAAQLGTAFLACPETKLQPLHLSALRSPHAAKTRVTSAFSGRAARGIVNRLMEYLDADPDSLLPYPLQSDAIRDIRAAANAQGRWEFQQLWAGQGAPLMRSVPAKELIEALVREAG
ncbi:MAG: NAD(P)H-dependent flavin oxidoreductase [Myxococcaceae bacterium]